MLSLLSSEVGIAQVVSISHAQHPSVPRRTPIPTLPLFVILRGDLFHGGHQGRHFHRRAHKRDRHHQVWQEGSHPQALVDASTFEQKLDYLHQNPVARGYVDDPTHWRYSSARNYAGQPGVIPVTRAF